MRCAAAARGVGKGGATSRVGAVPTAARRRPWRRFHGADHILKLLRLRRVRPEQTPSRSQDQWYCQILQKQTPSRSQAQWYCEILQQHTRTCHRSSGSQILQKQIPSRS